MKKCLKLLQVDTVVNCLDIVPDDVNRKAMEYMTQKLDGYSLDSLFHAFVERGWKEAAVTVGLAAVADQRTSVIPQVFALTVETCGSTNDHCTFC